MLISLELIPAFPFSFQGTAMFLPHLTVDKENSLNEWRSAKKDIHQFRYISPVVRPVFEVCREYFSKGFCLCTCVRWSQRRTGTVPWRGRTVRRCDRNSPCCSWCRTCRGGTAGHKPNPLKKNTCVPEHKVNAVYLPLWCRTDFYAMLEHFSVYTSILIFLLYWFRQVPQGIDLIVDSNATTEIECVTTQIF